MKKDNSKRKKTAVIGVCAPVMPTRFELSDLIEIAPPITEVGYPGRKIRFGATTEGTPWFDIRSRYAGRNKLDGLIYARGTAVAKKANVGLLDIGADGPFKVFVNGRESGGNPRATNPISAQLVSLPIAWEKGRNEIVIALRTNFGNACGFAFAENLKDELAGKKNILLASIPCANGVDIASSAYLYRADRKAGKNPPESWFALMRYAGLPFDQPMDVNNPAIKQVLSALLWEEIRPVQRLELAWNAGKGVRPRPEDVAIFTLDNRGHASSWWNNLTTVDRTSPPALSDDGLTYVYALPVATCGIVISVKGGKSAADYAVPAVRVRVADTWKKMDVEIEWGFDKATAGQDYSGRLETYDGQVAELRPIAGDKDTRNKDALSWRSVGKGAARRGMTFSLLYMGESRWRKVQPFTTQPDDVARTIVTVWTQSGNFSFLAADLENGPILAPEYGFFVRQVSPGVPPSPWISRAASVREYIQELQARNLQTIRQQTCAHEEQTWEGAVTGMCGKDLPPHPKPPAGSEPAMQVKVPSERLTAQWNLGAWHLVRHCGKNPKNGRLWFNDHPYGILAAETYMILAALDLMGSHKAAEDGFDQWVSLPVQPRVAPGEKGAGAWDWAPDKQHGGSLLDRPVGNFSEGSGCFTLAEGPDGVGGHMDGVHAFGPGSIGWALIEHYRLTGDVAWFKDAAPRIKANVEWMLRQRRTVQNMVPGGERLWCKGLQPALQVTPDSGGLWMQFYEAEAYYWAAVAHFAEALATLDPAEGTRLMAEAESYRKDLLAAVDRTIALSPVVPVRDGTYHSVIPFACYVRGLSTGAWGWMRDGSGAHVGPLYWETVQSAAALISPARLLPADDVRVQGYLDVLEDRLLLENSNVAKRAKGDWFLAGWQYQGGLERTSNMHLAGDDIPVFLRSFLNGYAIDILPHDGYIFNEHAVSPPPDKIFEEAAFLERFRNLLVMEDGRNLWLARATPRAWLEQGETISVKNAPTYFGTVDYEIVSAAAHGKITATVKMPDRMPAKEVWLRLRHPQGAPIRSVTVNGAAWMDVDRTQEVVILRKCAGTVKVKVIYAS